MRLQIRWSPRSKLRLAELLAYLEKEWSSKVVENLIKDLEKKLEMISQMPDMYKESEKKKQVRQCRIGKHTLLYYQVKGHYIEIITFWDGRQNPDSLQL